MVGLWWWELRWRYCRVISCQLTAQPLTVFQTSREDNSHARTRSRPRLESEPHSMRLFSRAWYREERGITDHKSQPNRGKVAVQ